MLCLFSFFFFQDWCKCWRCRTERWSSS